jgi:hypothetical protein
MQSLHRIAGSIRVAAFIAVNLQSHTARWTISQWRSEYAAVSELRSVRIAEMADLKDRLLRSIALYPDDYDGREPLWMRRENLRRSLSASRTIASDPSALAVVAGALCRCGAGSGGIARGTAHRRRGAAPGATDS